MATLTDYIPMEVRKGVAAGVALLALVVVGAHIRTALRAGFVQRLSDTPRYTRREHPGMFWLHVVFFAASAVLFTAILIAILWHWHDDKVF
jgi:hypothetical protein